MVIVFKASSLLERDALIHELSQHGITAFAAENSTSRKITDTTLDLSLEWHSVTFQGFPIFVSEDQRSEAVGIIQKFLSVMPAEEFHEPDPHFRRFYLSAAFSLMFPGFLHLTGLYNLVMGLRQKEPLRTSRFVFSLLLYGMSALLMWYLIGEGKFLDSLL